MKKGKISFGIVALVVLFVLSVLLIAVTLVVRAVDAEWWVTHVSRPLRTAMTTVSNLLPFSLTEVLVYLCISLVLLLLILVVVLLIKKKWRIVLKTVAVVLVVVLMLISLYTATASAEYKRDPLTGTWQDATLTKEEYLAMAKAYQAEYNALAESFERDENGVILEQLTREDVARLVYEETAKHADGKYLASTLSQPKLVSTSNAMSYLGISGIYLSLTGEANINTVTYYTALPTTIAHELSHSLQIMREGDASIYAFYICLGSQNSLLRYSSLQYGYSQLRNGIIAHYSTDSVEFEDFDANLSPYCQIDRNATNAVWGEYQGFINDVSEFFNDIYLKFSGVKEGTDSYVVGGATITPNPTPDNPEDVIVNYSVIQKMFIEDYLRTQS